MTYALLLGHSADVVDPELTGDRLAQAQAIAARLAVIDEKLAEPVNDGMATQVEDIKLDYAAYRGQLLDEGSRFLQYLANLTGLALVFNKYRPSSTRSRPLYVLA